MTVLDDRIEMAEESTELTLDVMFEWPSFGFGFGFGEDIDLTGTVVGLTLRTDDFPRD
ncbi:hypothetical protein [Streptomyces sp. MH13]|uniref:hypothetical protein n=1 Tax=unclassified Streptomyces TaxID=2593676 RepID=UPI003CEA29D2